MKLTVIDWCRALYVRPLQFRAWIQALSINGTNGASAGVLSKRSLLGKYKMAQQTQPTAAFDPYKNFKFR
jgi:hypothetical protein